MRRALLTASSMPLMVAYGLVTVSSPGYYDRGVIFTSPDGTTWTQKTIAGQPLNNHTPLTRIAYSPTLNAYAAVGGYGTLVVSLNGGATWTLKFGGAGASFNGVVWHPGLGKFFAYVSNAAYSSSDGNTWAYHSGPLATSPHAPVYLPTTDAILATNGSSQWLTASDGLNFFNQNGASLPSGVGNSGLPLVYDPASDHVFAPAPSSGSPLIFAPRTQLGAVSGTNPGGGQGNVFIANNEPTRRYVYMSGAAYTGTQPETGGGWGQIPLAGDLTSPRGGTYSKANKKWLIGTNTMRVGVAVGENPNTTGFASILLTASETSQVGGYINGVFAPV